MFSLDAYQSKHGKLIQSLSCLKMLLTVHRTKKENSLTSPSLEQKLEITLDTYQR